MQPDSHMTLARVTRDVVRHPVRHLLRKWNYKAAVSSAIVRGAVFFGANVSSGLTAATSALVTEFFFRFATSGFYGALTQALRKVEPARTGLIAALVALPAMAHTLELLVHWLRGTANLEGSIVASMCFTALSTSFNLFAMRRGVLIVGDADRRSLFSDVRAMPRIVWEFAVCLVREVRGVCRAPLWAPSRSTDLKP